MEREIDHPTPSTAKVKETWIYTATPPVSPWHNVQLVQHRDYYRASCKAGMPGYAGKLRWSTHIDMRSSVKVK
jgi:hypothetical protein